MISLKDYPFTVPFQSLHLFLLINKQSPPPDHLFYDQSVLYATLLRMYCGDTPGYCDTCENLGDAIVMNRLGQIARVLNSPCSYRRTCVQLELG